MAYENKLNLFSMKQASGKAAISGAVKSRTAVRGDYAIKQSNTKAEDFGSQLNKATAKADSIDNSVKADNTVQQGAQPVKKDTVAKTENGDTVQQAAQEKAAEANPNDAVAHKGDDAGQDSKVEIGDVAVEAVATDNVAALLQFMSHSNSIDALLNDKQLQPMVMETVVEPIAEAMVQPIADDGAKILLQTSVTVADNALGENTAPVVLAENAGEGAVVNLNSDSTVTANAAVEITQQPVQMMNDGKIAVPEELQQVQPTAVEALLGKEAVAADSKDMLNMLSGKFIPQSAAQEAVQNPVAETEVAVVQLAGDVKANMNNPQLQLTESDSEAVNSFANIMEGTPIIVEAQKQPDMNNQQSLHQQFAEQTKQMMQQSAPVNAEGQAQPMQMAGEAAFDVAPVEANVDSTTNVAGANIQQQFTMVDDVEAAQPVQQAPTDYEIPKQIVEQARMIRAGQDTEMVIKLNPRHLGELTLKVAVHAGGSVTATFHSDNATVRGIIETSMIQLKQELTEQGIKVDKIEISAGLQQDLQDMGQGYYAQQGGQQNTATRNDLNNYENGEVVEGEGVAGAASVDGVPVNNSTEPIRDSQGNIISDGVDYSV